MARRVYKDGPVTTAVIGTEEVIEKWANVNDATRVAMRTAITELATRLRDRAKALAPVRTGGPKSIRARIYARLEEKNASIAGIVYPRAPHSHLLEYGVRNQRVWVKPYELRRKRLDRKEIVRNEKTGKLRRRLVQKGMIRVEGYYRNFHVPKHPFMQPAFESMRGEVTDRLRRALDEGAGG